MTNKFPFFLHRGVYLSQFQTPTCKVMLACLCDTCHLFCCSLLMPYIAWRHFEAHLLNAIFTNKIDHITDSDGDRQIMFKSILAIPFLRLVDKYAHILIHFSQGCIYESFSDLSFRLLDKYRHILARSVYFSH